MSLTLTRYILTAALRDRLFMALLLVIAVTASMAIFLGSSAVIEPSQFALVFAAGGLRLTGIAGLVLFVVFFIRRSFEGGEVDYLLTRPISRGAYLLSHSAALAVLSSLVAFFSFLALIIVAPQQISGATFLWTVSFWAELLLITNAALFFSLVITSPVAATMAVFGLYVLGRLMGEMLGIVISGSAHDIYFMTPVFKLISLVIPRLDLLTQTSWLIYGADNLAALGFVLVQSGIYITLLLLAAAIDLKGKQF